MGSVACCIERKVDGDGNSGRRRKSKAGWSAEEEARKGGGFGEVGEVGKKLRD